MKEFLSYLADHGKQYLTEEEFMSRFNNFKTNLKEVQEQPGEEVVGYSIGLNEFSDWHDHEMAILHSGHISDFVEETEHSDSADL